MTGPPTAANGTGRPKGRFGSRLRDARIRSKLGLILVIPLLAVVTLAAVRLVDSAQRALSAEQVRSLATVSAQASVVAHELHGERMAAGRLLTNPEVDPSTFNTTAVATDEAIEAYQQVRNDLGTVEGFVDDRLAQVDSQLGGLDAIRQGVVGEAPVAAEAIVQRYGVILDDLLAFQESVGQVASDVELGESIRAVTALSSAIRQMAQGQALAYLALLDEQVDDEELTAFLSAQTAQQEDLLAFAQVADPDQLALVNSALSGDAVVAAERAADALVQSVGQSPRISAQAAERALGAMVDHPALWAEEQLHADQVRLATDLRDSVFRQVLIESVAALLALVITITVAVLLARMLARSLGQLRQNALAVAERDLPETVARLSDPRTLGENTPAQLAAQVREPIQLRSRDEIGQVAQAFNVVHRAAVRVAAEQAALRTSVSAMFLNLARRSQSLVDRMISQLDEIERNEEDPKRLARMFTLDHLATRMRRNDENLLVLAGADSSPPRSDDALVTDVLRAAQSEVEHYDRIEFGTVDSDVSVLAQAVNDVVRLVAELFDNATRFSPPDAAVVCEARRLGDQMIVQIEDRGVGMAQDQVNRLNAWLASPPAVEVTTFRKMGLAVVARLASRHQIRVELRCDPNYGTIAYVALPRSILVLPRSRLRSFEVPAPRSPMPVEQAPAPVPAAAGPPVPSRHLGQLPRRSAAVAHHAAPRRSPGRGRDEEQPTAGNGQPANHYDHYDHQQAETNRMDMPVAGRPLYELTAQQDVTTHQPGTHQPGAHQPGAHQPGTHQPGTPQAAASVVTPPPEATVELPIFREMEAVWFRSHGDLDLGRQAETPSAGSYPLPPDPQATVSSASQPPSQPSAPDPAADYRQDQPAAPAGAGAASSTTESWHTAADFGWRAAAAASQPTSGGSTQSGLPKRVPQAQLVPGSVDTPSAGGAQRRSPEEIRGLLSAYHRGVQRGRESGGR